VKRNELSVDSLTVAIGKVTDKVEFRLQEKGLGAYAGPHETYGIVAEEFYELMDALHLNDTDGFQKELLDIAVACVIGIASSIPAAGRKQ
jgi:hypothetical protein